VIGANMDPSHLFWQSADPVRAVLALGEAIFHVHLKDTAFNPDLSPVHGVLDTTSVRDIPNRCWTFRTVGYGHDALFWKQFISALQQVGYEDAVCIEHEDRLIGGHEGLQKSLAFLKGIVIKQRGGQDWWLLPDEGGAAED
jgi:sugar phosphate isomerase/epimerase